VTGDALLTFREGLGSGAVRIVKKSFKLLKSLRNLDGYPIECLVIHVLSLITFLTGNAQKAGGFVLSDSKNQVLSQAVKTAA
jgi:hypothetical protein